VNFSLGDAAWLFQWAKEGDWVYVWDASGIRPPIQAFMEPLGILISPAVGAVLMSFSTIVVAINAQLLRTQKL
jgi:hypothetical protein